jgi:hypothetical protein
LAFSRAVLDPERNDLPLFAEVIALPAGTGAARGVISDARFAPLSEAERLAWSDQLERVGSEPRIEVAIGWERKMPFAMVSIEPFRRDAAGSLEKLLSFTLALQPRGGDGPGSPKTDYPEHSRLASGDWYRFTVAKDGVCKLSYEFLRDLGLPINGLSSDRVNVYGNHQGMLPFINAQLPATDLSPNAVEVVDGGDGVLNPGDYILFYASGPMRWELSNGLFKHVKNTYTDSASYFIGVDVDPPVRVAPVTLSSDAPTRTVTRFNDRQVIDRDLVNLVKSGRTWYGETYDLTTTYSYNFETPGLAAAEPLTLEVAGAARTYNYSGSNNVSSFTVTSGGTFSGTINVNGIGTSSSGPTARGFAQAFTWSASGSNVPVTITFNKFDPITSVGWIDYLRLNCVRELRMSGDQLHFRSLASVGPGEVSEFVLDQSGGVQRIWEITDPRTPGRVDFSVNGQQRSFRVATDDLRTFIAFKDANYIAPVRVGRVPNQDLHATALPTDLVVVCPPEFASQARRLVERRSAEGLSVRMVSPQEVFNEFSSGQRDATAIKRYMRLLYDRAGMDPGLLPRYLLLFGDGSYNNISLALSNQNWIPSYQTEDALDYTKSYTSDDYFALLDAGEGEGPSELVDIGVGRLVASSVEQARDIVDKLLNYDALKLTAAAGGSCTATGDGGIGDWRTHVLFISDDLDGDGVEGPIHEDQSDFLARRVENEHPELNVDKLYQDAYQQVSTPGGQRYPQAISDLRDKVQKGQLLVNYVGHGGEVGWAHERLLDNTTIQGWTNKDRLPLFMTATCEFTRWDDPARTSAGELVLLNPNGGGIGLMTTTRLAYSTQNFTLGQYFYDHVFDELDEHGRTNRVGDVYRRTKRDFSTIYPSLRNHRGFTLIGDPSMQLAMPRMRMRITEVTDTLGAPMDTLKALTVVRVRGFVDDGSGSPMEGFNGVVVPTVYDKSVEQSTLMNDAPYPFTFRIRKNVIHRGRATVADGRFQFTFLVPKDINYAYGNGRIAVYAEGAGTTACGYSNDPLVGGTSSEALADQEGPRIDLFLNDERFVRGGITNESPMLFAKLHDNSGINTVGSSIGHDLLAVLDENSERAVVLNDLYEADLDTYRSGQVRYRFNRLAEGRHTLSLKAWDAANNSSERSTEFVVASSEEMALAHVLNYPNPFTTRTEFHFEHNRPCATLDVQVQVFTVAGRLVKTINRQVSCQGYKSEPVEWDGLDDLGDRLGRGVYVYRLQVAAPDGGRAEQFEKLVILR